MPIPPFHLAFPVVDLAATERFFVDVLGAQPARRAARWVDFNLHGHQVSAHQVDQAPAPPPTNPVDGDQVPVPHFGVVLPWAAWHALRERLQQKGQAFLIGPRVRFAGQVGEQATLFIREPSGNVLEFKSFKEPDQLFAR